MVCRLLVSVDIDNAVLLRLAETVGTPGNPGVIGPQEIADSFGRQVTGIVKQFQGVREVKVLFLPPQLAVEQTL